MFEEMASRIQEDTIAVLLKAELEKTPVMKQEEKKDLITNNPDDVKRQAKSQKTVGRNDPCPCGSGKKYKNCCGKNA